MFQSYVGLLEGTRVPLSGPIRTQPSFRVCLFQSVLSLLSPKTTRIQQHLGLNKSWLVVSTHLKNKSQLGWWHSQYMESHKISWFQTANQTLFSTPRHPRSTTWIAPNFTLLWLLGALSPKSVSFQPQPLATVQVERGNADGTTSLELLPEHFWLGELVGSAQFCGG